jgi:hypothetical protein
VKTQNSIAPIVHQTISPQWLSLSSRIAALIATSTFVLPISSAQASENCVQAQVVRGTTCSNVEMTFDVTRCAWSQESSNSGGSPQAIPARVICQGSTVTGRATFAGYRMEAKFKKSDDGWGAVNWTSLGAPRSFLRTIASAEAAPSPATAPAPEAKSSAPATPVTATPAPEISSTASASPVATETAPANFDLKVRGFLDLRLTGFRSADSSVNQKTKSGFLFEDGALYINGTREKLDLVIDLPISRNGGSTSADTSFGKTKAQAYGRYRWTEHASLTFGQFDTMFGFELNDSNDRVFGVTGLAYNQTLPVVHSGAYFTWAKDGFTARLLAANAADRQTYGADSFDSSTEYGLTLGYANSLVRFQLGGLGRAVTDLASSSAQRTLLDSVLGFTWGIVDLDLQYSMVNNPRKNTLTTDGTDRESAGSVGMVHLSVNLSESLKLSGRYEMLDKDPGGNNLPEAEATAAVINYKVQSGLTARVEWNDLRVKRTTSASAYDESRWDVGALVSF